MDLFPLEEYALEDYHIENGIYIHAGEDQLILAENDAVTCWWSLFAIGNAFYLVSSGVNSWYMIINCMIERGEGEE